MDEETWKPVFGGAYEVSSHGAVRSMPRIAKQSNGASYPVRGGALKLGVNKGYLYVKARFDHKQVTCKVHRLVAEAFCNKPDGCDEVNHKDGDKLNNHFSNLEWVTRQQNVRHQFDVLGQQGPWQGKKGADNPSSKPVVIGQYWYPGASEAARQLGMSQSAITHALKRGNKVKGMEASYG